MTKRQPSDTYSPRGSKQPHTPIKVVLRPTTPTNPVATAATGVILGQNQSQQGYPSIPVDVNGPSIQQGLAGLNLGPSTQQQEAAHQQQASQQQQAYQQQQMNQPASQNPPKHFNEKILIKKIDKKQASFLSS